MNHQPFIPPRIQLSRKGGWRMPPGAIKVDRSTPHGNPFKTGDTYCRCAPLHQGYSWDIVRDNAHAVRLFRAYLDDMDPRDLAELLEALRGASALACWCKIGDPCHADVWIERLRLTQPSTLNPQPASE